LPEEQRTVLLLVSVEGLPYAEVAAVVGVPLGTVMSRISRRATDWRPSSGRVNGRD
jgi:RNA polymerase sigma-70 factor (ECF subfamily)